MRKVLLIARREYLAAIKTKGFIIGLVLAPVMMSGGLIAMVLTKNQVDTTDKRIAVVDRTGFVVPAIVEAARNRNAREVRDEKTGRKLRPAYVIEVVPPRRDAVEAQRLELSDRVRTGQLHAFVELGPELLHPGSNSPNSRMDYYAKNPALDEIRRWISNPVNEELRRRRLREAGIDELRVKNLFDWAPLEPMGLVTRDVKTGQAAPARRRNEAEAVLVPMTVQLLTFLLFMMGAAPLLQSVMEEKVQRIAEVLLGSASPFQMMLGKVLGGVAVSLTGSAVYVVGALWLLSTLALGEFIPYRVLPWFFAFMLLAVFMYGAAMAALGSLCSDAKDAQNLQLPAMLPLIVPMFLLGPLLREPNSPMAVSLSLFPPFTPLLMLLRVSMPEGVPLWQPCVGLVGLAACTLVSVWAAARVFRIGILLQGKSPKWGQILRWAIKG